MKAEEIKEFVQSWMNGHEKDTFIKNEYGNVIYSAGSTSLNLTCFFEDLLTDFIELESEKMEFKNKSYAKDQIEKDRERVKESFGESEWNEKAINKIDKTPIILD